MHVSANRAIKNWDGSTVALKIDDDGRVTLITGEFDVGQGSMTILCQICANELGIPIEHINVNNPDTDVVPFCHGAIASRVTITAGNAVLRAAREAREKLLSMAAEKLETSPSDLTIENAFIHVIGIPNTAFQSQKRRGCTFSARAARASGSDDFRSAHGDGRPERLWQCGARILVCRARRRSRGRRRNWAGCGAR